ncbi:MAG: L,D-transpeptidase [Pseudolabrys sp.]|jgi:lipoprotein-anchoring transpeptidase ErfK/SrfK
MTGRFGAFLLALPLAAVLAVPSALAQTGLDYPPESGPPPTAQQSGPSLFGHQLGGSQDADPNAMRPPAAIGPASVQRQDANQGWRSDSQALSVLPPEDRPETGPPQQLPSNLQRKLVNYRTREPAGTIIVDTPHTHLYLVLGHGKAIRYGIGVGREGFTWSGTERISKMKEWPDWFPPKEMIERQPYLPRMMAGGPGNPLGARALYLGHTLYRIHGTNQPSTIGKTVSSGCIRLLNKDIEDLYDRVQVGTRVVVLPGANEPATAANGGAAPQPAAAPAMHRAGHDVRSRSLGGTTLFGGPLPPAH